MAVDTRNKRASVLGAGLLALTVFALPVQGLSAEGRRQALGHYAFSDGVPPVDPPPDPPPVVLPVVSPPSTPGGGGGGNKGKTRDKFPPLMLRRVVTDLTTSDPPVVAAAAAPVVQRQKSPRAQSRPQPVPAIARPVPLNRPPLLSPQVLASIQAMQLQEALDASRIARDDEEVFALLRQAGIL